MPDFNKVQINLSVEPSTRESFRDFCKQTKLNYNEAFELFVKWVLSLDSYSDAVSILRSTSSIESVPSEELDQRIDEKVEARIQKLLEEGQQHNQLDLTPFDQLDELLSRVGAVESKQAEYEGK